MADPPNHLSQQSLAPSPASSNRRARWVTFARWTGILALFYLLGPVVFLGRDTQQKAGGRVWQAGERWAHVSCSAYLSLLWYVPVVVFHSALAGFWLAIFEGLAAFLHLPGLRILGGVVFWLPVPSSMLLRWVLALPLTSWIALLLEEIRPQTTWVAKRVVSPDEHLHLAAEQEALEKKRQAALSRSTSRAQLVASKKPVSTSKRPRPSTVGATKPTTPQASPTGSLWDQIDWSQVPDDHPLKQAAFEEAERQKASRRNAERTRSVLSQVEKQEARTPPGQGATNEPATPAPAYNWDEGEGTVTES